LCDHEVVVGQLTQTVGQFLAGFDDGDGGVPGVWAGEVSQERAKGFLLLEPINGHKLVVEVYLLIGGLDD
jgi:hypothetical protein